MKQFWQNHKERIVFLLFLINLALVYKFIQLLFPVGNLLRIQSIDSRIPFLSLFVIPYYLYVPLFLLPFVLYWNNRKIFFELSLTFFVATVIANIIYVIYPTMVLRPPVDGSGILEQLVLYVYKVDSVLNVYPSGHVAYSFLANLCLFSLNKKLAYRILPLTVLVMFSTIFIGQHYVIDIVGGMLLASAVYFGLFLPRISNEAQ